MRERIRAMRDGLVDKLHGAGEKAPTSPSWPAQRGMFSYTGSSAAQVDRLREEFAHLRRRAPAGSAWRR